MILRSKTLIGFLQLRRRLEPEPLYEDRSRRRQPLVALNAPVKDADLFSTSLRQHQCGVITGSLEKTPSMSWNLARLCTTTGVGAEMQR